MLHPLTLKDTGTPAKTSPTIGPRRNRHLSVFRREAVPAEPRGHPEPGLSENQRVWDQALSGAAFRSYPFEPNWTFEIEVWLKNLATQSLPSRSPSPRGSPRTHPASPRLLRSLHSHRSESLPTSPSVDCSLLVEAGESFAATARFYSGFWPIFQPQTNPKYQYPGPICSSLALFLTPNHTLQLVETTLVTSLITQRSAVQIRPPQPFTKSEGAIRAHLKAPQLLEAPRPAWR